MPFRILIFRFTRLIYILLLVMSLQGIGILPVVKAQSQESIRLDWFDRLSSSDGYIFLNQRLYWTSDAGQTWKNISPSIPAETLVQDIEFIDTQKGWILWTLPGSDGSSSFELAYTSDRGETWAAQSLSLFEAGEVASYVERSEMGWFNGQTGWLAVKQMSGSNFSLGTLFTTEDGGKSWNRSALPVADRVYFADPETGWATGEPTGDQIFKTLDGGQTWQSTHLDPPIDISTVYKPFFAHDQGSLVATSLSSDNSMTLYVYGSSADDWFLNEQMTVHAQPGAIPLSWLDPDDFVAAIPGTNFVLRMRGGELEQIENQDGLSSSITELDMISLDAGWAKSVDSSCVTTDSPPDRNDSISCSSSTRLLETVDGGLTWREVDLPDLFVDDIFPGTSEWTGSVETITASGNTETFVGQGFDKCEIPTIAQLQTWWNSSPYKAVNLYIGGSSRGCPNSTLTTSYLEQLRRQGWRFIPTWVGPQAPCTGYLSRMSSDAATAYNQGITEANLAVEKLAELGLTYPDKTGSIVYYDIEPYGTNTVCRDTVKAFMNGWVSQLHARGNLAGVYGSTLCNTGLSDFLTLANVPDAIWPARWYNNLGEGYYDPSATVWNLGSCIPNSVWANHQRIRQYEGDHDETWGELTLGIDSNVLDGVVAIPYPDPARLSFQEVTGGLSNPVFITNAGDNSGRLFIVERAGRIRIVKNGALLATPFLDIQSSVKSNNSEQGLLGLAFHPAYETNGLFYVVYTANRNGDANGSVLTLIRYSVSSNNPDVANLASGATVLTIDHPTYSNHNGGTLLFGNDGYLYWSTGDGGSAGDPTNNAQNVASLLGKILRIDVNASSTYTIPASNPFAGSSTPGVRKEIWAYGLRNPWRISFDRATHDLYIGDVGQSAREEVDFQSAASTGGENYGWRIMEGSLCYNPSSGCNPAGKVFPVTEYSHNLGCSVTGGYVYRGSSYPSLSGYYLYGDFCSGRLFGIFQNSPNNWSQPVQLADTSYNISTFGEDEEGELYFADYSGGKIYQIQYEESFYIISGNTGVSGVMLSYTDNGPKTVTSQTDGGYSLPVSANWSGTITPSHACFDFDPASRVFNSVMANQVGQDFTATRKPSSGCGDIEVRVGDVVQGIFSIQPQDVRAEMYAGLLNGPVKIATTGTPLLTSQRVNYGSSFNEIMGYPTNWLTTEYWFPWYDQVNMQTWILVGNPSADQTAYVDIYIGGVKRNDTPGGIPYAIPPNGRITPQFPGVVNGPVRVVSVTGSGTPSPLKVFTSERSLYGSSFNEVMGYPIHQLTTEYWFPWYDQLYMNSWILVGNPSSTQTAYVDIYIGGTKRPDHTGSVQTYAIPPNGRITPQFPGILDGPVRVVSVAGNGISNPLPIFTSERSLYAASFNEVLGYPGNQLATEYHYTWYDNQTMSSWILVGNPSSTQTAYVDIYVGGIKRNDTPGGASYVLPPNGRITPTYNLNTGPVRVVSVSGDGTSSPIDIFTSERTLYGFSFNEMMGYPANQLALEYWFTWYDSIYMDTKIYISKP